MSPAGEQSLANLDLIPGQAQLEIEFFGISFAAGESLTFEYRLRGADESWSAPSPSRSVLFSNLAPGGYEFEVRSVSAGGERSVQTARATFRVLPAHLAAMVVRHTGCRCSGQWSGGVRTVSRGARPGDRPITRGASHRTGAGSHAHRRRPAR